MISYIKWQANLDVTSQWRRILSKLTVLVIFYGHVDLHILFVSKQKWFKDCTDVDNQTYPKCFIVD